MKIDFNAGYTEVNKLAFSNNEKGVSKDAETGFDNLLESVIKHAPNQENQALSQISGQDQPHFRINIKSPELLQPEVVQLQPELDQSVNTPTVLSARRVANSNITQGKEDHKEKFKELISNVGAKHGIDPSLSLAVAAAESSFNPNAVSSDGFASKGLFQLLDSTGKHMLEHLGLENQYDPFNPKQNVELGVGYLRKLHELFNGSNTLENNMRTFKAANSSNLEKLAVAAFNAGEGRVASAQQRAEKMGKDPAQYDQIAAYLPDSTRDYVRRVLDYRGQFEGQLNQEETQEN